MTCIQYLSNFDVLEDVSLKVMSTQALGSDNYDTESGSFSPVSATPRLVARTVAIDPLDSRIGALIELLPAQSPLAWIRRGDGIVGWGEVARFTATGRERFSQAVDFWNEARTHAIIRDEVALPGTGPVAFGTFGFSFKTASPSTLVVPRVVVGRRDGVSWLTVISTADSPFTAELSLDSVRDLADDVAAPGDVTYRSGSLSETEWSDVVAQAVELISTGELDKIVLARDEVGTATQPIDVRFLLNNLAQQYENCWTFSVDGMVGATPELLVRTEKGLVTSRVLAGTIQRTGDEDTDTARAAMLAHSSKDLEEHEYAVRSVADALKPFCTSMNVPESPFVLHLPNVLHLATDVTAVVDAERGATSLSLASALHPTAAVCGTPTMLAAATILDIEGMDRSRYAGPVGWMGSDGDGEWGIALRSAELDPLDPHTIRLFAGCGIVAASEPASELAETHAKLQPMKQALATR